MNQYLEDDLRARLSQHEAVIEGLEKQRDEARSEVERLKHDNEALRGSLGYAIPGDHDGKMSDGTTPVNGIAVALSRINDQQTAEVERLRGAISDKLSQAILGREKHIGSRQCESATGFPCGGCHFWSGAIAALEGLKC